jgi:Flp pilus assembly protein TadG
MREIPDRPSNTTAGRRRRALRQFGRDRSGASALEFALLAIPTILLLLAVLQLGLVFLGNYMLEHATAQGGRLIRTGQAQTQGFDAAAFKNEVCKYLTAPLSCAGLKLDVRRFTSFSSTELTNPLDASGAMKTNFSYDPGNGGDVVVVRGFYEFEIPSLFPIEISMANMKDGSRVLIATAAFRNEPFQSTSTSR